MRKTKNAHFRPVVSVVSIFIPLSLIIFVSNFHVENKNIGGQQGSKDQEEENIEVEVQSDFSPLHPKTRSCCRMTRKISMFLYLRHVPEWLSFRELFLKLKSALDA